MKEKPTFESAMGELSAIVSNLQSGELTLDGSLAAFEKAVELIRYCNETLESAKQKVRILTEAADGSVTDAPFTDSDEA